MAPSKKRRQIKHTKIVQTPQRGRTTRGNESPGATDSETVILGWNELDMDGPWPWLWNSRTMEHWWRTIFPYLRNIETMTWAQLKMASGAKKHGTKNHLIETEKMIGKAQNRLSELYDEPVPGLFSCAYSGKGRIHGRREGRLLNLVWYDPNHEVCPSAKK